MHASGEPALSRPSEVRTFLTGQDFHPSRALGQNFLVDGNILGILTGAAGIVPGDRVLEVGPGLGVVTEALLERGAFVVAVERDHRLSAMLRQRLGGHERLVLVEGDALDVVVPLVAELRLNKMVSNLPYNPGSRILMDLVRAETAPSVMVVMVQLEVGERLTAAPGSKAFGLLGLWCQLCYRAEAVKIVSPNCFWPRPAIRSVIVKMERREHPLLEAERVPVLDVLARHAFQHRRKQLVSLLATAPAPLRREAGEGRAIMASLGLAPSARPEDVPVAQWCALAGILGRADGR